jgi:hypothetical protein
MSRAGTQAQGGRKSDPEKTFGVKVDGKRIFSGLKTYL